MAEKQAKKSGPNISKLEWGMVISILGIIDIAQFVLDWVGIPFIATIGTVLNRFISFATGLAWPTYLYLRGIDLNTPRILTVSLGFLLEEIPDVDAMPFWFLDGLVMFASVEAEKKLGKVAKVAVATGAIALAPETGGASLAAEGAVGAETATEGAALAEKATEAGGIPPQIEGEEGAEGEEANEEEEENENEQNEEDGENVPEQENKGEKESDSGRKGVTRKQTTNSRRSSSSSTESGSGEEDGGGNNLDLRGKTDSEERQKNKEALRTKSNLLDLTLSYGERKKAREDEENSLTE